jgi:hypothetical protein
VEAGTVTRGGTEVITPSGDKLSCGDGIALPRSGGTPTPSTSEPGTPAPTDTPSPSASPSASPSGPPPVNPPPVGATTHPRREPASAGQAVRWCTPPPNNPPPPTTQPPTSPPPPPNQPP